MQSIDSLDSKIFRKGALGLLLLLSLLIAALIAPPAAADVLPGSDLWITPGDGTRVSFGADPLPAGFFGAGSDPLMEEVFLVGVPLVDLGLGVAAGADTIIERLATAELSSCPAVDTVPIEIRALRLRSTAPVTVTFFGGNDACTAAGVPNACCTGAGAGTCETTWRLDVFLSAVESQPTGSLIIEKNCPTGGNFTTDLPVKPRFVFTRLSGSFGSDEVSLDPAPVIDLDGSSTWVYNHGIEGVYRDVDGSQAVSPGDRRLSKTGPVVAGSRVSPGEADLGAALLAFTSSNRHLDPGGGGIYDAGEGIYDDADADGLVSIGDTRISVRGFDVGSVVAAEAGDLGQALVAFSIVERFWDSDSNGTYDDAEGIYRDNDTSGSISSGDSRLLPTWDHFPLGTVVDTGNRDVGHGLVPFVLEEPDLCTAAGDPYPCCTDVGTDDGTCLREMHANSDNDNLYDPGEGIYRDRDADGTVSVGDLRLTVFGTPKPGIWVAEGDEDLGTPLVAFAADELHTDPGGDGRFNSGFGIHSSPGGWVDGDGDGRVDEAFPPTSNFGPGIETTCDCNCDGGSTVPPFAGAPDVPNPAPDELCMACPDQVSCHAGPAEDHDHCVTTPCCLQQSPTAVTLSAFYADFDAGQLVLRWSTAAEIDNEGFHLLRMDASELRRRQPTVEDFSQLNELLVPAEGNAAFGADYRMVDESAERGVTYYYLLEDVSTAGRRTLHGAEACTFEGDRNCRPLRVSVPR